VILCFYIEYVYYWLFIYCRKESGKQVSPPSPSLSTAEWTPTFSRGRPRPSNLHSNVRANPSFPTRQAARNTVYKLNENSNKMVCWSLL
jgi:hypothetical protein